MDLYQFTKHGTGLIAGFIIVWTIPSEKFEEIMDKQWSLLESKIYYKGTTINRKYLKPA
jgi:hypothetical protein